MSGSQEGRGVARAVAAALIVAAVSGCGAAESTPSGGTAAGGTGTMSTGPGTGGGGGTGGGSGGATAESVLPQGTSLFIEVRDPTGAPVPKAWVLVVDQDKILIDKYADQLGQILLENLTPGRIVAQVRADGFTEGTAVATLEVGMHGGAIVVLSPLGAPLSIDADADSKVEQAGVEVMIPANSLVDGAGEPVSGSAEVTIVPIDPSNGGLGAMPGPLEGITELGGDPVNLETVFMADVSVWKDGQPVQLAEGAKATLRFPMPASVAAKYNPGDIIDAWSYDVTQGLWQKEGHGLVEVSAADPEKLVWTADVGHFTWWNSDHAWYEKHCFAVTVLDNNSTPVPNQMVTGVGVSYSGISWSKTTNAVGKVCVEVQTSSTARIYLGYTVNPSIPPNSPYVQVNASSIVSDCGGVSGTPCEPVTIGGTNAAVACVPGTSMVCPYSGPAGTQDVDICKGGIKYCSADGSDFGPCTGEILPQTETCQNGIDDNCNGQIDEPPCNPFPCALGQTKACYTGPAGTKGKGSCQEGTQNCISIPNGTAWSPCFGQTVPTSYEYCSPPYDTQDTNCNGVNDCTCTLGATQACYTGPNGTATFGICKPGSRMCVQYSTNGGGSKWGACIGEQIPLTEDCATPADEDCNDSPQAQVPPLCCSVASDCGAEPCITWSCSGSQACVGQNLANGTVIANQILGNCKTDICDGDGAVTGTIDDNDTEDDMDDCTKDLCSSGVASHPLQSPGTPCSQSGVCDINGACVQCISDSSCAASEICVSTQCVPAPCNDGIQNGDEAGTDCGGTNCSGSPAGVCCTAGENCASQVCNLGTCQTPTCSDGKKNGAETDVDCGNGCPVCAIGKQCMASTDCISNYCPGSLCQVADCSDGILNGTESDADCGGAYCTACGPGKICTQPGDCQNMCVNGVCN